MHGYFNLNIRDIHKTEQKTVKCSKKINKFSNENTKQNMSLHRKISLLKNTFDIKMQNPLFIKS